MESLSELKDALTTLGVSTATGDLRGQARRDELANRLQQARVASGQVAGNTGDTVTHASQNLDKMSLTELRSALELRQVSTQTPGLRGEARRHALVQRLININSNPQSQSRKTNSELESARVGSSTEDDETKSDTNSSVYSTANEFIYFDSPGTKRTSQPVVKMLTPQLSFTKLKRDASDARVHIECTESNNNSVEDLQRELFELRTKLHTARHEQQRLVDESLQKAGIQPSLSEISTKLQALERERRRLQDNYFGHELAKCEVLSSTNDNQTSLELVQEDALLLIEKHQETLKRLAKRTKEAMAVAKFHAVEIESGISTSARQEEDQILSQISHIESSLSSATDSSTKSSLKPITGSRISTLVHYRSMPNGLRHDGMGRCRQLPDELRSATSFRIRRDRVPLERGLTTARAPTQADKLGVKALFMEKATNNVDEIRRIYQRALELDENHADNLGNYALFLCTSCEQSDEVNGYFQRAITADSANAKNLANYANFLMRERKDYTKSEELYKRALKVAQKDVNIMGGYADLLVAMTGRENLLQAQRVLKKALIESPLHTNNQLRMASVLSALNENESAERCFEQLLAMTKQHGGLISRSNLVSIYETYAQFLHQSGQWTRAKHMYDEALALDPQRPSLLRSL
ncbi:Tetratricopeptide repeat [Phytophthora infestans]|uniref:Tetratricopeptide repeat n=1 Tax=Phytophthora infestans TaxID=4787 RepID=A0A8S9UHG5_PHYIN|nr:Tetratricopeptide repeat [Phytophthora infestans]KAF4139983.1 Tetratricopeptide repeat [Phytophthora infestans]